MNDPIVVTRNLVKRGWTDFEPKVITGLLTGSAAAFLISMLGQYGIHLSAFQQNELGIGCMFLGAYLTPSSGTTITRTVKDEATRLVKEIESHSGNSVSTVTNSTPIQESAPQPVVPKGAPQPFLSPVPDEADDGATAILPSTGSRFLSSLPSSSGYYAETDGH